MRPVKITQTMLKDVSVLLKKAGAVKGDQAYPSHVFMTEMDFETLRKNLEKTVKKQYPYLDKRRMVTTVGMELLNLGPVTLKKGIQRGYLLVDDLGIRLESTGK